MAIDKNITIGYRLIKLSDTNPPKRRFRIDITVRFNGDNMMTQSLINEGYAKSKEEYQVVNKNESSLEKEMIRDVIRIETLNFTQALPISENGKPNLAHILRPYRYTLKQGISLSGIALIWKDWKDFEVLEKVRKKEGEDGKKIATAINMPRKNKKREENVFYNEVENLIKFSDYLPREKKQNRNYNAQGGATDDVVYEYLEAHRIKNREELLKKPDHFFTMFSSVIKNIDSGNNERFNDLKKSIASTDIVLSDISDFLYFFKFSSLQNTTWSWFQGGIDSKYNLFLSTLSGLDDMTIQTRVAFCHVNLIPPIFIENSRFRTFIFNKNRWKNIPKKEKRGLDLYGKWPYE